MSAFELMNFGSDGRIPPGWIGISVHGVIVSVSRYTGVPPFTTNGAVIVFNPAEFDANTKAIVDRLNEPPTSGERNASPNDGGSLETNLNKLDLRS